MTVSTKANIKINGKDYSTDEILKNVSQFFGSAKFPNDPKNPKVPNISLGFKEKMILNTILKSVSGKNLEGFFNETLVAKIGNMEDEVKNREASQKSPNTQTPPTLEPEIIKNAEVIETPKQNDYAPINAGTSPQMAFLGIVAIGGLVIFLLKFFNLF